MPVQVPWRWVVNARQGKQLFHASSFVSASDSSLKQFCLTGFLTAEISGIPGTERSS